MASCHHTLNLRVHHCCHSPVTKYSTESALMRFQFTVVPKILVLPSCNTYCPAGRHLRSGRKFIFWSWLL